MKSSAPRSDRTQRRSKAVRHTDTRARLLEATRRCLRRGGIAEASSREITTEAGANLAAITYHFGSKDELVATALFGELQARLQPALELLADGGDPLTVMASGLERLVSDFESARADAPLYLEALTLASRPGPFADEARRLVRSVRRLLRDQVARLVDAGFAPPWTDPDAMAGLIVAVANGVAMQTSVDPRGPSARSIAGQFAGLLAAAGTSTAGTPSTGGRESAASSRG
jgi:AcrR family transcriptional regulator